MFSGQIPILIVQFFLLFFPFLEDFLWDIHSSQSTALPEQILKHTLQKLCAWTASSLARFAFVASKGHLNLINELRCVCNNCNDQLPSSMNWASTNWGRPCVEYWWWINPNTFDSCFDLCIPCSPVLSRFCCSCLCSSANKESFFFRFLSLQTRCKSKSSITLSFFFAIFYIIYVRWLPYSAKEHLCF